MDNSDLSNDPLHPPSPPANGQNHEKQPQQQVQLFMTSVIVQLDAIQSKLSLIQHTQREMVARQELIERKIDTVENRLDRPSPRGTQTQQINPGVAERFLTNQPAVNHRPVIAQTPKVLSSTSESSNSNGQQYTQGSGVSMGSAALAPSSSTQSLQSNDMDTSGSGSGNRQLSQPSSVPQIATIQPSQQNTHPDTNNQPQTPPLIPQNKAQTSTPTIPQATDIQTTASIDTQNIPSTTNQNNIIRHTPTSLNHSYQSDVIPPTNVVNTITPTPQNNPQHHIASDQQQRMLSALVAAMNNKQQSQVPPVTTQHSLVNSIGAASQLSQATQSNLTPVTQQVPQDFNANNGNTSIEASLTPSFQANQMTGITQTQLAHAHMQQVLEGRQRRTSSSQMSNGQSVLSATPVAIKDLFMKYRLRYTKRNIYRTCSYRVPNFKYILTYHEQVYCYSPAWLSKRGDTFSDPSSEPINKKTDPTRATVTSISKFRTTESPSCIPSPFNSRRACRRTSKPALSTAINKHP